MPSTWGNLWSREAVTGLIFLQPIAMAEVAAGIAVATKPAGGLSLTTQALASSGQPRGRSMPPKVSKRRAQGRLVLSLFRCIVAIVT